MKVIMLGAPGAGKGTQADMIAAHYGIPHISTGDIFRENLKKGTALGKKAQGYMDKGELVPDELTVEILLDRISREDCRKGYVLDGFPRTIPQADVLDKELKGRGEAIDYCINVDVPAENIVTRMGGRRSCPQCGAIYHIVHIKPRQDGICDKCGAALIQREDDKEETVRNRLHVYEEQTAPLIDYYTKKGLLWTVDGTREMKQVTEQIFEILKG